MTQHLYKNILKVQKKIRCSKQRLAAPGNTLYGLTRSTDCIATTVRELSRASNMQEAGIHQDEHDGK